MQDWLESFPRLPIDDAVAHESVRLRQQHGLKVPDAILLATAICSDLPLATRYSRDFRCGNRAHNGDAPATTAAA